MIRTQLTLLLYHFAGLELLFEYAQLASWFCSQMANLKGVAVVSGLPEAQYDFTDDDFTDPVLLIGFIRTRTKNR